LLLGPRASDQEPSTVRRASARREKSEPELGPDDSVGLLIMFERDAQRPLLGRLGRLWLGIHDLINGTAKRTKRALPKA
jgi:hypothetical protein